MFGATREAVTAIWASLGGPPEWPDRLVIEGAGDFASVFPVTDLAAASVAAACLAMAELLDASGVRSTPAVDRRLSSWWFACSIAPQGWEMAPAWDAIAGDYEAADGWIRLHTNAPHHRAAALAVLGTEGTREAVTGAARDWRADDLELAIVERGGCAAAMRSLGAWAAHEQGRAVAAEPLVWRTTCGLGPSQGWRIAADRPLRGIRVLDMTRVLAGPVATRFLAGFGAEVLRIDPPGWDEPGVVPDVTLGKRCARLDLRVSHDLASWERLLRHADVLVHGYRPGALEHLGLGAEGRAALRPGLIDVSLDAYGWTGPWRERRGFDSLVQMSSGIADAGMSRLGRDKPTPMPVQALDHATGYLMAAVAIRGLTERLGTGRGSVARASLARTAALLAGMGAGDASPLAPLQSDDLSPGVERTPWGDACRVRPPCGLGGASLRWELPACELGSAVAAWNSKAATI